MPPSVSSGRDLRLDLFRGLALWLIFPRPYPVEHRQLDYDPQLRLLRCGGDLRVHFGLYGGLRLRPCDAERGFIIAGARILKRAWTVYIAHVFIFVIFMAQIAYLTTSLDNPLYSEEMRAFDFLQQPGVALIEALLLKFQPNFMDVLPLYIVLLIAFPLVLWLLLHWPIVALALSVALYAAVQHFYWNLPAYPTGTWFFNPLALATYIRGRRVAARRRADRIGRWCARATWWVRRLRSWCWRCWSCMTWYFPRYAVLIPKRCRI
jgi:hypothetical protein